MEFDPGDRVRIRDEDDEPSISGEVVGEWTENEVFVKVDSQPLSFVMTFYIDQLEKVEDD